MTHFLLKKNGFFVLLVLVCLVLAGCKSREEKEAQKAKDLITAKTLGLAYLEEFQLDNAEKEFLKFIDLAPKEKLGYANLGLVYLRMGKYPEAEKQLDKAIRIDPRDADIRLILATVYKLEERKDDAVKQLKEALQSAPNHIKVLYELTETYATMQDAESKKAREIYMKRLVEKAPANLVPRLNLTDILIREDSLDAALAQLEIIQKQFPDFPREAVEYFNTTLSFLRKGDRENALIQFTIFHNYLKVSSPYQAGIMDLKGPGGSLMGFPLMTFDQKASVDNTTGNTSPEALKFSDATAMAGLNMAQPSGTDEAKALQNPSFVEAADFDGDGDIDLYVGCYDAATSTFKHYLLSNEMNRFKDITSETGLKHTGKEYAARFVDYDNDGFLDLYIVKDGGDVLYRNAGKGSFKDVSREAKIGIKTGARNALWFDADHDGDLDLYELRSGANMLFRNNGDGTFTEQAAKMGVSGANIISNDAAFGDFDEDGDLDFVVVNENGNNALFSNQREGMFKDIAASCGLKSEGGSGSIAVGDYNNDGFLDLFIGSDKDGNQKLYRNLKDGRFETEKTCAMMFAALKQVKVHDATFFDFDNDGYLDLIVAGEPAAKGGRGLYLYRNDGKGNYKETSGVLPDEPKSARHISLFDYNNDGDQDLLIASLDGKICLLRNDGGNNNHYLKMKLVGLKAGSAKNNHFGIGAKVEVRSGELYQTMVVTDPNVIFGLGQRSQADIVRITWTNGVPQNIFMPSSNQSLVEPQTLKGSCPFLYTWDGQKYIFAKDILWRSALGMPLGIMGGKSAYSFADASDDYIKIPGEILKPRKSKYSIQITSELWETIYFDKLELIVVDHPDSIDIFVPEQFTPPPFPGSSLYKVGRKKLPVSAIDSKGNDVLSFINKKDDVYLSDFRPDKYQGVTEMKDLVIDLGDHINAGHICLFMNGWIFPTDASINVALSQTDKLKVSAPVIQVINKKGEWQTVINNLGFPMGKDKTVIADLSGKFLTSDHRVRIRTNMEIYWDYIFFSEGLSKAPVATTLMKPASADIHYRGFSRSYRKGGRYGPHWFDYADVSKEHRWRDLSGNYTRYGNVMPLLQESDNQYIISNAGDETSVAFNATALPPLKKGWKRDFLIHSVGWVKDGDLNTAYGNAVAPLPYHGLKSYPPGEKDHYPNDPALKKYNREYNTRVVTSAPYRDALKNVKN